MSLVKLKDRRTGTTYVYESKSYWDKEKSSPARTGSSSGNWMMRPERSFPPEKAEGRNLPKKKQEKTLRRIRERNISG